MKRKEKRNQRVKEKVREVVDAYRFGESPTDPLGQYTGITQETKETVEKATPEGKIYINPTNYAAHFEVPVQDADDL